jgi:methylglyoxal synthase
MHAALGTLPAFPPRKRIALVAHDHEKPTLLEWARSQREILVQHELFGTGTTGGIIARELDLSVHRFLSGPLGGDQQLGAAIAEQRLDLLIFFWDPLEAQPHDPDVRALLRLAVLWNIPCAMNTATADFLFSSPLVAAPYTRREVPLALAAASGPRALPPVPPGPLA